MSYSNGRCNDTRLVRRYIGSAYDTVKTVADNIDNVVPVGEHIDEVIKNATNMDDIVAVSNALGDYRVSEEFTLVKGQMSITTSKVVASACDVRIAHPDVDQDLLENNLDYTKVSSNKINFNRSYPEGAKVYLVQYVTKDEIGELEVDSFVFDPVTGELELKANGVTFTVTLTYPTDLFNKGRYAVGNSYSTVNDYFIYVVDGEPQEVFLKDGVDVPYVISLADPRNDSNLLVTSHITKDNIGNYTDFRFDKVSDMLSGGSKIVWSLDTVGTTAKCGGTAFVQKSYSNPMTFDDFDNLNPIYANAFGDSPTDNELNQAIAKGGIIFNKRSTPWLASNLVIDSGQYARCEVGAPVKLRDGANSALIKTARFDSLLGTNAWFASEGVPDSFEINLLVDGNKANQADGTPPPIQIYGKGYESKSIIYNGKGGGFYSACAQKGGQESVEDLPEAQIEIYSYACDEYSLEFQGPHDGKVSAYLSGNRDGKTKGALFTAVPGQTNGQCEIGNLHVYGMDLVGIQVDVAFSGGNIISESNLGDNFVLNSSDNLINSLRAFGIRTLGKPQVVINGSRNVISGANISCLAGSSSGNLLEVNGNENEIKGKIDGNKNENNVSAAVGVKNNGSANDIDVTVINCITAYEQGDNVKNSKIEMHARNCKNLYNIGSDSSRNEYKFTGYDIENAPLSTPNGRPSYTDVVKGVVTADGTVYYFENSGKYTDQSFDMTSTEAQTLEIPHGLPYAPDPGDVGVSIIDSGSTSHEEQYGLRIQFVNDTIIKVGYRLKVAGTGTANVAWRATV